MRTTAIALLGGLTAALGCPAAAVAPPGEGVDPPAGPGAMAPNLSRSGDEVLLTWLEPVQPHDGSDAAPYRLRFARYEEGAWGLPRTIVERNDFFANWADLPSIVPAAGGALYAHWLQKTGEDLYAYSVMMARSTDGAETWQMLGPVHDDATETEHGFVSLVPAGGGVGGVRSFWLDGREMVQGGAMTLRTALVSDTVGTGRVLDDRVCECCSTSAAVTSAGPVFVYRDRSDEEVRDVSIVRLVDGHWTKPKPVHRDDWLIAGCPVNGPVVAARGDLVVVAWFTGAVKQGAVLAAFSTDGGASFSAPITLDDTMPLGRVDLLLAPSGDAIVCWLDTATDAGTIQLCRATPDGDRGPCVTVATTGQSRASGFPRIAFLDSAVLVVWTEEGDVSRLRGVSVPLAALR